MTVAAKLKTMHFDIGSYTSAVRQLKNLGWNTVHEFNDFQIEAVGQVIPTKGLKEAEIMTGYIVQEAVRLHMEGFNTTNEVVIEAAKKKTVEFFVKNPWCKDSEEVLEATEGGFVPTRTNKAPRKSGMSKKERCITLYKQHEGKPRKELIEIFVAELGLTPPGASTYVANCKSGLWK